MICMSDIRKSLYVETTIPSYATSRQNQDIIIAGKQALTRMFWEQERHKYDLKISALVIEECSQGDTEASLKRLAFLGGIMILPITQEIISLANVYQRLLGIPDRSKNDCFHLSVCVVARIDYLLTWNCAHLGSLAYAKTKAYNDLHGLWTPVLTTPDGIMNITGE